MQLLQLEHAGKLPALQVTSTRAALEAATKAGLISLDDEDTLWIAWSRATSTRNALVLAKGRTLDVLPIQGDILGSVAVIWLAFTFWKRIRRKLSQINKASPQSS